MNNVKMLFFDRIDVSEGINFNKKSTPKECDICHFGVSCISFTFQLPVCKRCHD